jgi:hypothetical protein
MGDRYIFFRAVAWLCIFLAASTCLHDACLARSLHEGIAGGGLKVQAEDSKDDEVPFLLDAPTDSLASEQGTTINPVFKKWWVWALITTAIAVTAVLAGGGGEDKATEESLPDFPDPPDR